MVHVFCTVIIAIAVFSRRRESSWRPSRETSSCWCTCRRSSVFWWRRRPKPTRFRRRRRRRRALPSTPPSSWPSSSAAPLPAALDHPVRPRSPAGLPRSSIASGSGRGLSGDSWVASNHRAKAVSNTSGICKTELEEYDQTRCSPPHIVENAILDNTNC